MQLSVNLDLDETNIQSAIDLVPLFQINCGRPFRIGDKGLFTNAVRETVGDWEVKEA